MKFKPFILTIAISSSVMAQSTIERNNQNPIAIAIYNDNLALINEQREVALKEGINDLIFKDVSASIIPQSLITTTTDNQPLAIIEQNFDYDLLSPQSLLNKAVGQEIEVTKTDKDGNQKTINAKLLSNNGRPIIEYDGRIEVGNIDQFAFTKIPDNLKTSPSLSVKIESPKDTDKTLNLSYESRGLSWQADYNALLNQEENKFDINGLVTIRNNSGSDFKNAKLVLIAGDVNQVQDYEALPYRAIAADAVAMRKFDAPQPQQENFSDYHLYQMPYATDLNNNQSKQLSLLSAADVGVNKIYSFVDHDVLLYISKNDYSATNKSNQNSQTYSIIYDDSNRLNADVTYQFKNNKENHLGIALPKGTFRLYQKNQAGNAILVGEAQIGHTADNQEVNITTGKAFDITLAKKLINQEKLSDKKYRLNYEVIIHNAKDNAINSYYTSDASGSSQVKLYQSSIPVFETLANTHKWKINVPAKSSTTLNYTLDISYE